MAKKPVYSEGEYIIRYQFIRNANNPWRYYPEVFSSLKEAEDKVDLDWDILAEDAETVVEILDFNGNVVGGGGFTL